jgi:cytidylate kinase
MTTAPPVIAIDGPSASGKGTVARKVADILRFNFLDSGALYRLVALAALDRGLDLENAASDIANLARALNVTFNGDSIRLDGRDVTDTIREERMSRAASKVAALQPVRDALLERQRAFRRPPGLVADGRDMGSVVFPDATLKIFLTADAEERARRRHKQLMEKGMSANMDALLQEIHDRDARDSERAAAPLQKCADALELNTTGMSVDEAVARVVSLYGKRVLPKAP